MSADGKNNSKRSRQGDIATNHEKGSRNQDLEVEKRETSEVGQPKNDRTGTTEETPRVGGTGTAVPESLDWWLSDNEAREIPQDKESAGSDRV